MQDLVKKLGTSWGTIVTIGGIFTMGFTAGVHYNNYSKNIELLESKKINFKEIQDLTVENGLLKIENKEISHKLTEHEARKKR